MERRAQQRGQIGVTLHDDLARSPPRARGWRVESQAPRPTERGQDLARRPLRFVAGAAPNGDDREPAEGRISELAPELDLPLVEGVEILVHERGERVVRGILRLDHQAAVRTHAL